MDAERAPGGNHDLAVVNDVSSFIRTTLGQPDAPLRGENWLAGNWSVRGLVDRLGQCGVKVEVKG